MYYILAIVTAFLLSAFQYLYRQKAYGLFVLRFLTYLVLFILLINPKIETQKEIVTKPDLYVLADNTLSVVKQKKDIETSLSKIKSAGLIQKYNLHFYQFSNALKSLDSLKFDRKQTDIANSLSQLAFLHNSRPAPVVLLTDGQSNTGLDYNFNTKTYKNLNIYPVVLGDTLTHQDIRIDLINVNPYVFKDNYFPVEIFVTAQLKKPVQATLKITENNKVLFKKKLPLSPDKPAGHIQTELKSGQAGIHQYKVILTGLTPEKNKRNNIAYFSIEVLKDQKKILLVSNIIHPDIGAIKRSLNQQKNLQFELTNTQKLPQNLQKYQSLILYQPDNKFKDLFVRLKKEKIPWWLITGKHTDWNFINTQKIFVSKQPAQSYENYFAVPNKTFSLFKLPELQTDNWPPLIDTYGKIALHSPTEIVYYSKVNDLNTKQGLLFFNTLEKQAVLAGENIWQWRMHAGLNQQQKDFDQLLWQIIRYLSIQKDYKRLQIFYDKQFYQGSPVVIRAKFLDENLEPDLQEEAVLILYNQGKKQQYPLLIQSDYYQVEIPDLAPGKYTFNIQNKKGDKHKKGQFIVLPYSLEAKNLSANLKDLTHLAHQTGGQYYFPDKIDELIDFLQKTPKYKAQITYQTHKTALIDTRWLLFLLVLLMTAEWLYKKLKGQL